MASSLIPQFAPECDAQPLAKTLRLARVLELWHLTSLDAPTVAIVWTVALARSAGVHLQAWILLLIGCGTWTVYVLDRLLDARRAIQQRRLEDLRERHYFHWRHRRLLLPMAGCAAVAAAFLIFRRMPALTRDHDSVIAAAALAYFSGVHVPAKLPRWARRIASKELLVGVLFTAGCAAPSLSRVSLRSLTWPLLISLPCFALLAWLNCAAIESWESRAYQLNLPVAASALAFAASGIAIFFAPKHLREALLLNSVAGSALLIVALDRLRTRIGPVVSRALADLVLLAPGILLIPGALRG